MCYPCLNSSANLDPKLHISLIESAHGSVILPVADYLQRREASWSGYPESAAAIHLDAQEVPASFFHLDRGDPDDWAKVTVGGCRAESFQLRRGIEPPTKTPNEFLQRLRDRTWTFLHLGDYHARKNSRQRTQLSFLLVVEWKEASNRVASRSGALVVEDWVDAGLKKQEQASLLTEQDG